mgnify:FL=1
MKTETLARIETKRARFAQNAIRVLDKKSDAVAFVQTSPKDNRTVVSVFYGKQTKPAVYSYAKDSERAAAIIKSYFESRQKRQDYKKEQRASEVKETSLTVGDIVYTSWGYEQTNVSFFQIIEIVSKQKVIIREIAAESIDGSDRGYSSDRVMPVKDSFIGEKIAKRSKGDVVINAEHSYTGNKWDGRSVYRSWGY